MAKEHYNAVRESDLYEYGGTRKVLLTYIAGLIIGSREEDAQGKPIGEPDKDEGWCVARQEILAAYVGCSREEACRQIIEFESDGWLTVERFVDTFGHKRCRYTITPAQMKNILARKMKREKKHGIEHPIRAEKPAQARGARSHANLVKPTSGKRSHNKGLEAPCDQPSQSDLMNGHKALRPTVTKPCDQPSIPVVDSVVPSLGKNSSHSETTPGKNRRDGSTSLPKEGKENQERQGNTIPAGRKKNSEPKPPRRAAFKPEVEAQFRAAGAPDLWFEAMAPLTQTIDTLNGSRASGCPRPLQSWLTIAGNHPEWKAAQIWTPKISPRGDIEFSEVMTIEEQVAARRANAAITPEELERNRAQLWWGGLGVKGQNALVPEDEWVTKGGISWVPVPLIVELWHQRGPKRTELAAVATTRVTAAAAYEREYDGVDDI